MKTKRILSLIIALLICSVQFNVFAQEGAGDLLIMPAPGGERSVDYSDISNWAYWNYSENGKEKAADLFIICPTVDMGSDGNLTADVTDGKYRDSFVGALNMELGIYKEYTSVYAPFYSQVTFPVYNLEPLQREEYLEIAYKDVKDAFLYYADNTDSSRPLILAGFSQGSDLLIRLMKELFDEEQYAKRLVAAYSIGWKLTEEDVKNYPHLVAAKGESDTGVIVTFNTEAEEITSSQMVGKTEKTYSINPLNWRTDYVKADKSENLGACFTDYGGNITKEIPNLTGAYIDEKRGTLKVTDIKKEDYSNSLFDDGIYHLYDYQFFFRNLQENVKTRLDAFLAERYINDKVTVEYMDEIIQFDVEPVIENGRTLVPFRAIFEKMGCCVDYFAHENGKQTVYANRGNDSLLLNIGESRMYFNNEEIALDVPAKIKDSRTLVPVRAISEAFECKVDWDARTKKVTINPPDGYFEIRADMLSKTVTDKDGMPLIEAVAYYPVIENPENISFINEINDEYKIRAQTFIESAAGYKEDAVTLAEQVGKDDFAAFEFNLTFESPYNLEGILSLKNYFYAYTGGAHPLMTVESRNFDVNKETELSLSQILDEKKTGEGLREYVYDLFSKVLSESGVEADEDGRYTELEEAVGDVQFYLTGNSLVLYFDPYVIAPYAVGSPSVELFYDESIFLIEM